MSSCHRAGSKRCPIHACANIAWQDLEASAGDDVLHHGTDHHVYDARELTHMADLTARLGRPLERVLAVGLAILTSGRQKAAAADYAKLANSPRFAKQKETSVRQLFTEKVLGEILGHLSQQAHGVPCSPAGPPYPSASVIRTLPPAG